MCHSHIRLPDDITLQKHPEKNQYPYLRPVRKHIQILPGHKLDNKDDQYTTIHHPNTYTHCSRPNEGLKLPLVKNMSQSISAA